MEAIDLTGKVFGRVTVLRKSESRKAPCGAVRAMWLCQCQCGNQIEISSQGLKTNKCPSCGCFKREQTSKNRLRDLTGQKFGRLTVIKRAESRAEVTRWLCLCECGKETIVGYPNLANGHTKSCGCYNSELVKKRSVTHGMRNTRLYEIWKGMKNRCENPNEPSYMNYGGRGICVCAEWHKPEVFMEWALENGYSDKLTIDRINYNGNYEPGNCRWATAKEQGRNKRNNFVIAFMGKEQPLSAWCEELNLDYDRTWSRLRVSKWSIEEAFSK